MEDFVGPHRKGSLGPFWYNYKPLSNPKPDLRLVRICPGAPRDSMVCHLITFEDPSQVPKYQALSHTWGSALIETIILIESRLFSVTANLEAALQSLRRPAGKLDAELFLWIDAICIDQGNIAERDEQVRRMRDIYRDAERVIVWLGDYYNNRDDKLQDTWGIREMEKSSKSSVLQALDLVRLLDVRLQDDGYEEFCDDIVELAERTDLKIWVQLARLFYRPWFERLWIIQGIGVASNAVVRIGRIDIPWESLEKVAR